MCVCVCVRQTRTETLNHTCMYHGSGFDFRWSYRHYVPQRVHPIRACVWNGGEPHIPRRLSRLHDRSLRCRTQGCGRVAAVFVTRPFTPSLLHSFTHSLLQSFTPSLLYSFTPSPLHSFTPSLLYSFAPSLLHSFTPSLLHSFAHSLLHSLTHTPTLPHPSLSLCCTTNRAWPSTCSSRWETRASSAL